MDDVARAAVTGAFGAGYYLLYLAIKSLFNRWREQRRGQLRQNALETRR